jgi:hypothetical protein
MQGLDRQKVISGFCALAKLDKLLNTPKELNQLLCLTIFSSKLI